MTSTEMSAANAAPATSAKTTEIAISFFIINPPETSGKEATDGCVFGLCEAKFSDNPKERKSLLDMELALL
jgi:hypothetical protein